MENRKNNVAFGKAGLKFFAVSVGIILASLVIAGIIILINGSFTYWVIVPLLAGLPLTMMINVRIAKKTISQTQSELPERGTLNE